MKVVRSHLQVFRVIEKKPARRTKESGLIQGRAVVLRKGCELGDVGSRPRAGAICVTYISDPLSLNCTSYILKMREMGISGKHGLSNPLPLPTAARLQKYSPGQDGKTQRA